MSPKKGVRLTVKMWIYLQDARSMDLIAASGR
jgi:hypothetical protein